MHHRRSGLLSEGRLRQYDELHDADLAGVYCTFLKTQCDLTSHRCDWKVSPWALEPENSIYFSHRIEIRFSLKRYQKTLFESSVITSTFSVTLHGTRLQIAAVSYWAGRSQPLILVSIPIIQSPTSLGYFLRWTLAERPLIDLSRASLCWPYLKGVEITLTQCARSFRSTLHGLHYTVDWTSYRVLIEQVRLSWCWWDLKITTLN